jgi:hypothetical protein
LAVTVLLGARVEGLREVFVDGDDESRIGDSSIYVVNPGIADATGVSLPD